jgi:quercetin dioxygenase-like cupin family protein
MKRNDFIRKTGAIMTAAMAAPALSIAAGRNNPGNTAPASTNRTAAPKVVPDGRGRQLNVIGDKMTLKLTGKETNGQYVLIEQNNEPGVGIPLHVHENEDEIFRVIEGQLEVQVADKKSVLGPGDLVFCPRGIPHTWRVVGDGPAKVDLSFFPAGLEDMFEELAKLPPGPPDLEVVSGITSRYGVHFVME